MIFQFKVIDHLENLMIYKNKWDNMAKKLNNQNPFLEFQWIKAWWETIGNGREVEIYALFIDEEIIGFIPLERKTLRTNHIEYSFIANGDASYMDFLVDPTHHKQALNFMLDYLLKKEEEVSISMFGLVENGNTSKYLDWYLEKNAVEYDFTRVVAPYISINQEDQTSYFYKRRKSFALNRLEKKFEQQGEVIFEPLTEVNYQKIYKIFEERWKMKNDTSGFSSELSKCFHNKLITETNLAVVDGLFLDKELVAYTFGYRIRGTYIGFSIAFNPNFDCFGLGNILDRKIIEKSFEVGDSIFDFSIGFEPYKFNWATEIQYIRNYYFGNKNASKVVKKKNFKRLLKEKLKKSKRIVYFKRNTLGKWSFYLRNPFRILTSFKKNFHFSKSEIYNLPAKKLGKEFVEEQQISLIHLQKMKSSKQFINNSFKESKYFILNNRNMYEVNNNLIVNKNWNSTIELPKNAVYINGPIVQEEICHWNDQEIFISINALERNKRKILRKSEFLKQTTIYSINFFKFHRFFGKKLKLKSPKRYKFI